MSSSYILMISFLIFINLGLVWVLISAPIGMRTVKVSRLISAKPSYIWAALFPLGKNATWDGSYLSVQEIGDDGAVLELDWDGRDGKPIRRSVVFTDLVEDQHFTMRTSDDSSLDSSFWQNHSETVSLAATGNQTRVTISETDSYKGFAFLVFRYFKNRRQLANLDGWVRTGVFKSVGIFEKAPTQFAMALLSALLMWPFFGLTNSGLILSLTLTSVVALHEVGHMFAFRVMGHRSARMIFIPILGGIALGGRPYDRHFEVGFSALMGAGFSALPVAACIAMFHPLMALGYPHIASIVGAFAVIGGVFNLANLVPIWKFDGGQVIRQLFDTRWAQGIASFILLGGLMAVCKICGFSYDALMVVGVVFALLSLITTGSGVKPRHALHPMSDRERILIMVGLIATFLVHAFATIWGVTVYL
ncbi:MAG: site-2 protease family protein [Rhizobiaceae bacterium]